MSAKLEYGPLVVIGLGVATLCAGVSRYIHSQYFGFADALNIALAMVAAGVLLLVCDYVIHHALLVIVMPVFIVIFAAVTFRAFDVALGLVLLMAVGVPAMRDWKDQRTANRKAMPSNNYD